MVMGLVRLVGRWLVERKKGPVREEEEEKNINKRKRNARRREREQKEKQKVNEKG